MRHPRLLQISDLSRDEPITEAALRSSRFNQATSCTSDTLSLIARTGCFRSSRRTQGCSTLLTEAPLGQSIKPRQSGGVSVLIEGADFIPAQHVVSEAAQPGEDT